jgi:hypothetical protein
MTQQILQDLKENGYAIARQLIGFSEIERL